MAGGSSKFQDQAQTVKKRSSCSSKASCPRSDKIEAKEPWSIYRHQCLIYAGDISSAYLEFLIALQKLRLQNHIVDASVFMVKCRCRCDGRLFFLSLGLAFAACWFGRLMQLLGKFYALYSKESVRD